MAGVLHSSLIGCEAAHTLSAEATAALITPLYHWDTSEDLTTLVGDILLVDAMLTRSDMAVVTRVFLPLDRHDSTTSPLNISIIMSWSCWI